MLRKLFFTGSLIAILLLTACATQIKPSTASNPPPSEAFMNFTAFEMTPVALAPAYASQPANQKALVKIQENVSANLSPSLASWNQTGAKKERTARTLVINLEVTEIKFIGGGTRFMVGFMAGSSAVVMKARITEKETGKTIAAPEFYAVAGAWSGGWPGKADNLMLNHIADQLKDYLVTNYAAAVGGPTGGHE